MTDNFKNFVDAGAVTATWISFYASLPNIVPFLSGIWLILRILESLKNLGFFKGRKARTRKEDK